MASNKKPGSKTLCTPEMVRALSDEIERGASIKAACGAVGIDSATLIESCIANGTAYSSSPAK